MVIVDSITFHFRQDFDDLAQRTRVLSEMALKFMKLAKKFSLAVSIHLNSHYISRLQITSIINSFTSNLRLCY